MLRMHQFSLRTLLLGVTICALLLFIWTLRPPAELTIKLSGIKTAIVDNDEVELADLNSRIEQELWLRRLWRLQPYIILQADSQVSSSQFTELISSTQKRGVKKFQIRNAQKNDK